MASKLRLYWKVRVIKIHDDNREEIVTFVSVYLQRKSNKGNGRPNEVNNCLDFMLSTRNHIKTILMRTFLLVLGLLILIG